MASVQHPALVIDILSAYLEFGSEIAGRKIRLGSAQKNTTLFVRQIKRDNKWQFLKLTVFQIGDLGESVTVEELKSVFSVFGPLVHRLRFLNCFLLFSNE